LAGIGIIGQLADSTSSELEPEDEELLIEFIRKSSVRSNGVVMFDDRPEIDSANLAGSTGSATAC
jgi:hypothetical protein